jgi:hypothetical protein
VATKATGEVTVGSSATQVVAANGNRRACALRVTKGEVWLGKDNAVTVDGGYYLSQADAPLVDNVPATDAWWAIARPGQSARVCYLDVSI